MKKPLRVLIVEDSEDDTALLVRELRGADYDVAFQRVDTPAAMNAALDKQIWDIVTGDYSMPHFSGTEALKLVKGRDLDMPFIFVSGTIGEDTAVAAMKMDAHDYIMKGNLKRFVPAIQRELRESEVRRERKRAGEEILQQQALIGLLKAVAIAANEAMTTDEAFQVSLDEICHCTNWPVGHVYFVDEAAKNRLIPSTVWHLKDEVSFKRFKEITQKTDFEIGIGLPGRVLKTGKPAWIVDVTKDENFPRARLARDINVKAGFGFPILVRKEVTAVLEFFSEDAEEPDKPLLDVMAQIGTQLGRVVERKRSEERIREHATLIDITPDAIIVRDMEDRILFWNKGAEHLYGWSQEEAKGKKSTDLLHKEVPQQFFEANTKLVKKGEWNGELLQVTKDGKEIIVDSRWILRRSEKGRPESILSVNTNITEKKKLEAQFLRMQRMESIGTLAGGIAHDLNNILAPILMSTQILKSKLPDEQSQRVLATVETAAQRGAGIVKQVLTFARGVEGERVVLQVKHLINDIEKIIKETFLKSIEIGMDLQRDLWTVEGDATQLHQVLMNLCVNARDAMPKGGKLTIKAENLGLDETYARTHLEAKGGPYVVIAVSDTGMGMPPGIMERIFEPFFTTKSVGKGTGLGLATVSALVKSHGGFVNVYSEVGKGTQFKIYLAASETGEVREAEEEAELPKGSGELVLVVDDEASIRDITKETLEAFGYRVESAADGTEGVALYAEKKREIDVVLTDMMMPYMDGPVTIRALQKIDPQVKIIAMSGLAANGKSPEVAGARLFLGKPYTAEKLLKVLHEVLTAG